MICIQTFQWLGTSNMIADRLNPYPKEEFLNWNQFHWYYQTSWVRVVISTDVINPKYHIRHRKIFRRVNSPDLTLCAHGQFSEMVVNKVK